MDFYFNQLLFVLFCFTYIEKIKFIEKWRKDGLFYIVGMDFIDIGFLTQGVIRFKFGYLPQKKKKNQIWVKIE